MPSLRLVQSILNGNTGPESVSGSGHANAYGMVFTTQISNVVIKSCTVHGDIGSYTAKLYAKSGSSLTYVSQVSFNVEAANTDTPVDLNITVPTG